VPQPFRRNALPIAMATRAWLNFPRDLQTGAASTVTDKYCRVDGESPARVSDALRLPSSNVALIPASS